MGEVADREDLEAVEFLRLHVVVGIRLATAYLTCTNMLQRIWDIAQAHSSSSSVSDSSELVELGDFCFFDFGCF